MRVFIAGIATETNTFAPFPTGRAGFEEYGLSKDTSKSEGPLSGPLKAFRRKAEAAGDEVIESLCAFAEPSGRTVQKVWEELRDEILSDLAGAGAVDLILLMLHGAMVSQECDDCEGEIIARARALHPSAVIGVELDLHCHLTTAMVEQADFVVPCKEYPHIDFVPRAKELFDLCRAKAEGRIRPVAALVDTAMVGFYPTLDPPMSEIVADLKAAEARAPILTAGIAHGFPWGDVAEMGTRVLVYADGDAEAASREAMGFARRLYGLRETLLPRLPEIADSLERARGLNGRIVLGDFADNPGGGAPGDSTFFLRAMLERNLSEAAVGCIYDPMAAATCAEAGVGAKLAIRLGGKSGPASGDPLDLAVEVMAVEENHSQGVFGGRQPLGRSVWLKSSGIDVVVSSVRTQVFERDAFTGLGVALDDKRLVVVKSSNHFQAGFRPGADHIWAVASPGALGLDFAAMPYERRKGDYFPRLPDPWAAHGEPSPRIFTL